MMYAKVIHTGIGEHSHSSADHSMYSAERFDFAICNDGTGRPFMRSYKNDGSFDSVFLDGDVWVMSESGKTIDHYSVPYSVLQKNPGTKEYKDSQGKDLGV